MVAFNDNIPSATAASELLASPKTPIPVFFTYPEEPFGDIAAQSGTLAGENPFRFSTKYHDEESGLLYYGYRYYDPELGRWPSRDPIGEWGGLGLYRAFDNASIFKLDYLGLSSFCEKIGCCDLCEEDDPKGLLSATIHFRNWNARGNPDSIEDGFELVGAIDKLQLMQFGAGCAEAAFTGYGAEMFAQAMSLYISKGMSWGWNPKIKEALRWIEKHLQGQQGFRIWVHVQGVECKEDRCKIIFKRLDWVENSDWYKCQETDKDGLPFGSGHGPVDAGELSRAIARCAERAVNKLVLSEE